MSVFKDFLEDTVAQVKQTWKLTDAPKFITQHTYLRSTKYSFKDHEFQEIIARDDARIVNTQKCSQIGMSELTARWTVAVCNMIPDFSAIITFPFSGDANNFAKTRVDPFITASPKLKAAVNPQLNNSDIKQFGTSLLYFRGTNGKTQAISIPADLIVSDEIDRSDPHVLSQYHSRLTHSDWKLRRNFSTPTVEGYGIALEMESSKRYKNFCKCNHCNFWFLPNYFEHVKIPDFDGELKTLNKTMMMRTRYLEAYLICPRCSGEPDLGPEHREYVCENPDDNYEAHGYYVSPFDAPRIITPVDLLVASTTYARYSEFVNQNLGLTSEDAAESLTLADLNATFPTENMDLASTALHAMGIDMGLVCHIVIGRLTLEGQFLIVWRERCPVSKLEERKLALQRQYRIVITVMDSLPYVDVVQRFQRVDKNLYGAVYASSKRLEHFQIKMFEGDEMAGKLPIHTVHINRDKGLDMLMSLFKLREVLVARQQDEEDELWCKHLLDMKRVQVYDDNQELVWTWIKSKAAQDHYHHATLYCYIAAQLRGTANRNGALAGVTLLKKFKVHHPKLVLG
jgi:hypothetical protein